MNTARKLTNDGIIEQIQMLASIQDKMLTVRPGMDAPARYDADKLVEAIKRLADEIKTEDLEASVVPS